MQSKNGVSMALDHLQLKKKPKRASCSTKKMFADARRTLDSRQRAERISECKRDWNETSQEYNLRHKRETREKILNTFVLNRQCVFCERTCLRSAQWVIVPLPDIALFGIIEELRAILLEKGGCVCRSCYRRMFEKHKRKNEVTDV